MTTARIIQPLSEPRARTTRRRLFVRDLVLPCQIGVWAHEKGRTQRVRISVELDLEPEGPAHGDQLANVLSYDDVVGRVRALVASGHINLVETLAESIVDGCLLDRRVSRAWARVEKLDILPDGGAVGVEVERVSD